MEVAPAAGGEYSFAVGVEERSVYGCAAKMERCSGGVDFAVNMVKANSRVKAGGEEERVRRVE